MRDDVTFIYGVGATKAGTSWLHAALASHPQVHARSIKELHYWSTLEGQAAFDRHAMVRHQALHKRDTLTNKSVLADPEMMQAYKTRAADLEDLAEVVAPPRETARYVEYMTKGCTGDAKAVIETTPAYGLLSVETLKAMAASAPLTKVIYTMRDPVARAWSHIRMRAEGMGRDMAKHTTRLLDRLLAGGEKGIAARGDYVDALDRLKAAIPTGDRLVMFYEDLMNQSGFDRVLEFLGLAPMAAPLKVRVKEGVAFDMNNGQRDALRAHLAPQYAGVNAAMGRLPDAWHANWMRT